MSAVTERQDEAELSVSQAARMLGVSVSSLRAWAALGDVPHVRTAGGHRRFRRDDLQRFLTEHGGTLPAAESLPVRRLVGARVAPHPDAAEIIGRRRDAIVEGAQRLDASGEVRTPRARAARAGRLAHLVDDVTAGLDSGDLSDALRLVDWWAYRAGAAGLTIFGPAGDVLAVSRAIERALAADSGSPGGIRAVRHVCDLLVAAVASAFTSGLAARSEVLDVD